MGCCTSAAVPGQPSTAFGSSARRIEESRLPWSPVGVIQASANVLANDVISQLVETLDNLHEHTEKQQEVQARAIEDGSISIRCYDPSRPKRDNGVALDDFGSDAIRDYLSHLSSSQISEMLQCWCLTSLQTERVPGGFRSQAMVRLLPDRTDVQTWSGEVCTQREDAEKSASVAALATMMVGSGGTPRSAGQFIQVFKGDLLEILVRDVRGWAYCRGGLKDAVGWLPSKCIAELATVIADHCPEVDSVLNVRAGQRLEVLFRHFCGWSLCREWHGIDDSSMMRHEGWVTDAYLDDGSQDETCAMKFHRLIAEALARIAAGIWQLKLVVSTLQENVNTQNDSREESLEECLASISTLSDELQGIDRALSDRQASDLVEGASAVVARGFSGGGPLELSAASGDLVSVLHVEDQWIWCCADDGREGWMPRQVFARRSIPTAPTRSTQPPQASLVTCIPGYASSCNPPLLCAICFDPLDLGGHTETLPCAHTFHRSCLVPWLLEKQQCPLCRTPSSMPALVAPAEDSVQRRDGNNGDQRHRSRPSRRIFSTLVAEVGIDRTSL